MDGRPPEHIYKFLTAFLFFTLSTFSSGANTHPAYGTLEEILIPMTSVDRIRYINGWVEELPPGNDSMLSSFLINAEKFAKTHHDQLLLKEMDFIRLTRPAYSEPSAEKRLALYQELLGIYSKKDDSVYIAYCLHQIGAIQFILSDFGPAFENQMKAEDIVKRIGYHRVPFAGKFLHDFALNYYFFKKHDDAIRLMQRSIALPKYNNNLDIQRYNTLGMCWLRKGNLENALSNLDLAMQRAVSYRDTTWIGLISGNIGQTYAQKKDYKEAINWLTKDYELNKNNFTFPDIPLNTCSKLAKVYLDTDSLRMAKKFIDLTLSYMPSGDSHKFGEQQQVETAKNQYYENLYRYYLKTGAYKAALSCLDSLTRYEKAENDKYNSALIEISQYNLEIKEQQLRLQNAARISAVIKLRFSIVLIIISFVGAAGFLLYYRKRKEKQILSAQHEITRMEKERMEAELKKARTEISRFVQKINEQDTFIDKISAELEKLNSIQTDEKAELKKHLHELRNSRILTDEDWTSFKDGFDWLYPYFSDSIRRHSPNITLAELRYLMLTKLGFTHKQMSLALGIAPDSLRVTWNRVRNKLGGTPEDTPGSLLEKVERSTVEMI